MKTVVIMRGCQGSGKSTYVKDNFTNADFVVSADSYFEVNGVFRFDGSKLQEAHNRCLRLFVDTVQRGVQTVVVDNINSLPVHFAPYGALAEAYGYRVRVVTLMIDPEKAAARNIHGVRLKKVLSVHQDVWKRLGTIPNRWESRVLNWTDHKEYTPYEELFND